MTTVTAREYRRLIADHGASLHRRGLVPGSSGNISARVAEGILVTPTNSCMGELDPERISLLDFNGRHITGDPPSKEAFLHLAFYRQRDTANAVVHLHSHYAVALSCLADVDSKEPIRPFTPYFVMKIGQLKVLPYFPPGDIELAHAVENVAQDHHAVLLANHGPVVAGDDLSTAVYAIEELEAAARLHLELDGRPARSLSTDQQSELKTRFGTSKEA